MAGFIMMGQTAGKGSPLLNSTEETVMRRDLPAETSVSPNLKQVSSLQQFQSQMSALCRPAAGKLQLVKE